MFPPCGGGGKLFLALAGNPCGKLYSLAAYIVAVLLMEFILSWRRLETAGGGIPVVT
jgi:hypothetical protein